MTEEKRSITVDASGERLGRLASRIAFLLNGKDDVRYAPNRVPNVLITVEHASRMEIDERRRRKTYTRYTGYFGGRKERTLGQMAEQRGYREVLRRAIHGMLPNNRLRDRKMRRVRIQE